MVDLPPDLPAMHPTFVETFETFSPNGSRWRTSFKWDGIGAYTLPDNGERQLYVDPGFTGAGDTPLGLDPFRVDDGKLIISAMPAPDELADLLWGYPYISGMISTYGRHAQTYGYFEIRAKMPAGKGLWTAVWLMPVRAIWPPEIDILEVRGQEPTKLYMNLHTTIPEDEVPFTGIDTADLSADFHTYGLAWDPERIIWFLDGVAVLERPTPGDMHQPMHFKVTPAVGGDWPGLPDSSTPFPAELVIDHVRIFQFDNIPADDAPSR